MSEDPVAPPTPREERESAWSGPFVIFGIAVAIAGGWALYEMLAFADLPTFIAGTLPTVGGVVAGLALFFFIGARAPPNE